MRAAFWISAVFVTYTYLGYPLWLLLRSRWRPRPVSVRPDSSNPADLPLVSIVIAVHNEAESLPQKMRNLSELDYPRDRYEIIVVSDGSTDSTDRIMAAQRNERLHFFVLPEHAGKAVALNRALAAAQGEIVVFTDARQAIDPGALRYLVAKFADPAVGCVSGELVLGDAIAGAAGQGLGLYWRLEKKIREWEAASGSVIGASGALYAARKDLLEEIPAGCLLDDVYLPLHVARQGKRVLFEPRALAYDHVANPQQEFRRKVRTLTGNYQLLQLAPWLLTERTSIRFRFVSHKLFRLWVPFALVGLIVTSALLKSTFYQAVFVLQLVFYGLSLLALGRLRLGLVTRLADISLAFVLMNSAAAVALVWFLAGKKEVWSRTSPTSAVAKTAAVAAIGKER
jgi:biofilm PGA synthesis N-glycosyltransferase PgaC